MLTVLSVFCTPVRNQRYYASEIVLHFCTFQHVHCTVFVRIHTLHTTTNVYLHSKIVNLCHRYVSLYVNTTKHLPDIWYHSYAIYIYMTKVVWSKAMIRKDDKGGLYFSTPF